MVLGVDLRCLQGGVVTGVGEYARRTLAAMLELDPLLVARGYTSGRKPPGLKAEDRHRIELVQTRLPSRVVNLLQFFGAGQPLAKSLGMTGTVDALWLPNPGFVRLSQDVPTVLTVHDLSFFHYPELFPWRGRVWYSPAMRQLLRQLPASCTIAAVSRHTAADVSACVPGFKGRITVVPPGVGPEFMGSVSKDDVAIMRRKYKLPERYLLSLGTIEPRKNYQLLLRAYELLLRGKSNFAPDLVVAGAWGWRTGAFTRELAKLASRHRVHILGYVAAQDKPALYSGAELFLYPSIFEGFGMPALEAMALGVPVLASHSSSLPEVVGDSGLLLDPWRPEAWANAIDWLVGDEKSRQELGIKARARARGFTWQRAAASYLDIFKGK